MAASGGMRHLGCERSRREAGVGIRHSERGKAGVRAMLCEASLARAEEHRPDRLVLVE